MKRRIAVRGIVVQDGKLLCVVHKDYGQETLHDYWCTPGGGLDVGEALIPALEREMIEETGVKPVIGNLLYLQQYQANGTEHIEFFFHVTNSEDYLDIDLSKSTHGEAEIGKIEFINPSSQATKPKFLSHEPFEDLANQATKIFNNL